MVDHSDLGRELMGLANDDRAAGAALLDIAGVADAIVAFHAQQAVEKPSRPSQHRADLLTPYAVAARYGSRSQATVDRAPALHFAAAAVRWAVGVVEP